MGMVVALAQAMVIPVSMDGNKTLFVREFSASPGLCRLAATVDTPININDDYGACRILVRNVQAYTRLAAQTAQDGSRPLSIVRDGSWSATVYPASSGIKSCTIMDHISGHDPARCAPKLAAIEAAHTIAPWAWMLNSVPFGPGFEDMKRFLYDPRVVAKGRKVLPSALDTAQRFLLEEGYNVKIIPVVGSSAQSSGFMKIDMAQESLYTLCMQNYTWRFLPPGEDIARITCNRVAPGHNTKWIASVGGVSVLGSVQQEAVTMFEFADPISNWQSTRGGFFPLATTCDPVTTTSVACLNPGHRGLRYIHYPGWHQPYFIALLLVNMDAWNSLTATEQNALESAARVSVDQSYYATKSLDCRVIQAMLDRNQDAKQVVSGSSLFRTGESADMKLTTWSDANLYELKVSRDQFIEEQKTTVSADPQQRTHYRDLIDLYQDFVEEMPLWTRATGDLDCPAFRND